jgi:Lar family restriction alleviation protein
MTEAIKPCPFCGWDAPYIRTTGTETEVYCQSCTAVGPLVASNTPEEDVDGEAIRLWNRRAMTCPPCTHDCNQGRNCPARRGK